MSNHIDDVAPEQKEWLETWPEIMRLADEKDAMVLFGDEASFAQWGSLNYTWDRWGEQPTVKTSGKRKAYKIMGFIDYVSGAFFTKRTRDGSIPLNFYGAMSKNKLRICVTKFEDLTKKVDEKVEYFANLPESILGLMGRYCKTLGAETA